MKKQLLILASSAGIVGAGALGMTALPSIAQAQTVNTAGEQVNLLADEKNTVDVVKDLGPSVVSIDISLDPSRTASEGSGQQGSDALPPGMEDFLRQFPQLRDYFNQPGQGGQGMPQQEAPLSGQGSGFVVDDQGRILTNFHVVQEVLKSGTLDMKPGGELTVSFPDTDEKIPVKVVGANDFYDLALLELVNPSQLPENAKPLPIANSDELAVGQKTIAIGNPYGFASTVTTGVVSGVSRSLPGFDEMVDVPLVQTDAAINPGNSGGPLLDSDGQVIGINTAIIPGGGGMMGGNVGNIGIGFAVPSKIIQDNLPTLEKGGLSTFESRPRLGIAILSVEVLPEEARKAFDLPDTGMLVEQVESGSAAEKADIKGGTYAVNLEGFPRPIRIGGDVITKVNGESVSSTGDLQRLVLEHNEGDTLTLTVLRDGKTRDVDVTLAVVPQAENKN